MHKNAIRAGVIGATGYTGRELVRLLGRHPRARLAVATSEAEAGRPLETVRAPGSPGAPGAQGARGAGVVAEPRSAGRAGPGPALLRVEDAALEDCDVVFSCLPHGEGREWVAAARGGGARVIDLSSDLRLPGAGVEPGPGGGAPAEAAVYGLPELFREELRCAGLVANPGCYPTAVLVGLAPLLRRGLVAGAVVVNAASGVTGAGRSPKRELLFGEVAEDYRAYGVGNGHRHVREMRVHGGRVAGGVEPELVFTPHLLPVRRGILATMYVPLAAPLVGDPRTPWLEDYAGEPFVEVVEEGVPSLSSAVGSNRVVVGVSEVSGTSSPALLVIAAVDNLLKGAAGQAVQNMNLCFGLPETEGLPW